MKEYTYTNKAYLGIKEGIVPPAPQYLWLNSKDDRLYKFGDNGWEPIGDGVYITKFDWNSLSYTAAQSNGEIILSKEFFEAAKARKTIVIPLFRGAQTGIIAVYVLTNTTLTFIAQCQDCTVSFRMSVPSDITEPVTVPATYMSWTQVQPKLVSGDNIKTINGESIIGRGNLNVGGAYVTEFSFSDLTKESGVTVTRAFAEAVYSKMPILIPISETGGKESEYIAVTNASTNDPSSPVDIRLEFSYAFAQYRVSMISKAVPEAVVSVSVYTQNTSAFVKSIKIGNQTLTSEGGVLTIPEYVILNATSSNTNQFSSTSSYFQMGSNATSLCRVPLIGGTFNFTIAESSLSKVIKPVVIFSVDSDNSISPKIHVNEESVEVKWKNGVSNNAISKGTYIMSLIIFKEIDGTIHAFGEINPYQ